jgi:hypothetical protein
LLSGTDAAAALQQGSMRVEQGHDHVLLRLRGLDRIEESASEQVSQDRQQRRQQGRDHG